MAFSFTKPFRYHGFTAKSHNDVIMAWATALKPRKKRGMMALITKGMGIVATRSDGRARESSALSNQWGRC